MEFYYENQGTNTYIVYEISDEDAIDSMSLGMLTNNKIPGLAPALFTQMDAQKFIKYNVSAKVSVKQFFEGHVNKKRLLGVFNGIVDAMLSAEEYMIDTNSIILDLNYIFADVSSCETVLVCLPVYRESEVVDLATFFKTIMFSTQFDQTENCDHVAKIINYLNSALVFSLSEFKSVLDSLKDNDNAVKAQPTVQPKVQQPIQQPVQQPVQQPIQQPVQQPVQQPIQQPVQQPIQQPIPQPVQKPAKSSKKQKKQKAVAQQPVQQPVAQQDDGDKISLFGLLMHYNKENKAKYNAQKSQKKSGATQAAAPAVSAPAKKRNNSFQVPGAPSQQGFAIPGQAAPPVTAVQQPIQQPARAAAPQPQPKPQPQPVPTPQPVPVYSPQIPQGQSANFGETTVLGGGKIGETTVLGASSPEVKVSPYLMRIKNNERINLNKPVFRIGKEKSYVDYFVSDNTAVSRSHANIISRDDQFFIVDTNSTNHTYVNGGMIQSNVEVPLSNGTKIRLANEEFEFRMY